MRLQLKPKLEGISYELIKNNKVYDLEYDSAGKILSQKRMEI